MCEIIKTENGFAVEFPFVLKDKFRKTFPSAKWNASAKRWEVGSRSGKKLEAWVVENAQQIDEGNANKAEFEAKKAEMVILTGSTFDIKDELKERFNAVFEKTTNGNVISSHWLVPKEIATEAQAFVNDYNQKAKIERKANAQKGDAEKSIHSVTDALKSILIDFKQGYKGANDDVIALINALDEANAKSVVNELRESLFFVSENMDDESSIELVTLDEFSIIQRQAIIDFLTTFNLSENNLGLDSNGNISAKSEESAKQTISTQETYEGILSIDDVKPIIKANTINFAVAVEVVDTDKYHGDARSFGYPVDEGCCTVVTFEPVMGAIVEDTIAAIKTLEIAKKSLKATEVDCDDFLEDAEIKVDEWCSNPSEFLELAQKYADEENKYWGTNDNSVSDYTYWNWEHKFQLEVTAFNEKTTSAINNTEILTDCKGFSLFEIDEKYLLAINKKSPTFWSRYHKDDEAVESLRNNIFLQEQEKQRVINLALDIKTNMDLFKAMAIEDYNSSL